MLRILAAMTVVLIAITGCSPQSSTSNDTKVSSQSQSTSAATGVAEVVSDQLAAVPRLESGAVSDTNGNGTADTELTETPSQPQRETSPEDSEMREEVRQWLQLMGSDAAVERRAASDALDELGNAGIPSVVWGLQEGSVVEKRGAAIYLIGRVSPRDSLALGALIKALAEDDEALRHAALQAVEKLDPEQLAPALPALLAYAKNGEEAAVYRSRAVRAITKLGTSGAPAATDLIELAREDGEPMSVRRACFYAIGKVAAAQVAEQFYQTQLTSDKEADLRRLAAKWLPGVAGSQRSLECLLGALGDADESVRLEAVDSLVAIGRPSLPLLITALGSPDVLTRRHAVLTVGKLGVLGADAVPALKQRLEDPDRQVRDRAKAALKVLQ